MLIPWLLHYCYVYSAICIFLSVFIWLSHLLPSSIQFMPTLQRCLRLVKQFQGTISHFPWRTSLKKGNLKFVSFKDHVEESCWEPARITGSQALGQTPIQARACFSRPRTSVLLCTFWKAPFLSPQPSLRFIHWIGIARDQGLPPGLTSALIEIRPNMAQDAGPALKPE